MFPFLGICHPLPPGVWQEGCTHLLLPCPVCPAPVWGPVCPQASSVPPSLRFFGSLFPLCAFIGLKNTRSSHQPAWGRECRAPQHGFGGGAGTGLGGLGAAAGGGSTTGGSRGAATGPAGTPCGDDRRCGGTGGAPRHPAPGRLRPAGAVSARCPPGAVRRPGGARERFRVRVRVGRRGRAARCRWPWTSRGSRPPTSM